MGGGVNVLGLATYVMLDPVDGTSLMGWVGDGCVCVEHLNRCKTSNQYCHSRGMERTYEAPSNEAPHMILGYHWGRSVTYLQFSNFLSNGNRLSLQPDTRFQLRVRLPQSAL